MRQLFCIDKKYAAIGYERIISILNLYLVQSKEGEENAVSLGDGGVANHHRTGGRFLFVVGDEQTKGSLCLNRVRLHKYPAVQRRAEFRGSRLGHTLC